MSMVNFEPFDTSSPDDLYDSIDAIDLLPVQDIPLHRLHPGFGVRATGTDPVHAQMLAEVTDRHALPPILVQKSNGQIIDGMHRCAAARIRGDRTIAARLVNCTDEDAFILAVRSNTLHGLPLSRTDRITGAAQILGWHPDWSDRAIGVAAGLSARTIAGLRRRSDDGTSSFDKRIGRDGKRRPVNASDGRRRAVDYITAQPGASLREIARETDVSLATVHDVRSRMRRGANPLIPERARPPASDPTPLEPGYPPPGQQLPNQGMPNQSTAADSVPTQPMSSQLTPNQSGHNRSTFHQPAPHQYAPDQSAPNLTGPTQPEPIQPPGCPAPPSKITSSRTRSSRTGAQRPTTWPAISPKLANDPSLRYTESGRAFVNWIAMHAMRPEEWLEFVDSIPPHWVKDISLLAEHASAEWSEFAKHLKNRQPHDD
jgi:hypothetical protein